MTLQAERRKIMKTLGVEVLIYLQVERQIAKFLESGSLDGTVVECLMPGGNPHDFEGFVFDYKFFIQEDDKDLEAHIASLIRDIASFYNSMGGYLFAQFPMDVSGVRLALKKDLSDCDKINQLVSVYLGKNIGVRNLCGSAQFEGQKRDYVLFYIPKRPTTEKPRPFVKNSKNIGDAKSQKFILRKNDIYCRYEHECRSALDDVELLSFLFSDREFKVGSVISTKIENNLPPRDPNLIRFVGRREYIEALWQWICEPRRPIKVLTAAGGLGKTTIAYEFATEVLDRPGSGFEKIVWLSGKKITFAAILGRMVSTTRCDFENVDELLDNLLLEIGSPLDTIEEAVDREEKISLCIEAFSSFSILLVVDDVDSLPREEQNNLYSVISQIIIASNVTNDNSRVLFTSRLELLTGSEQRILMKGFEGEDFDDYLDVNVNYLLEDERQAKSVKKHKNRIKDASAGSPIFITSIIRLVSLGHDLGKAVSDWRGKNGEQIRAFAFEREIDQLTPIQREILYAMQLLSRARVNEIEEICDLTSLEVETELSALKDYHLYATKGDPVSGTVLEVPEPIRLMHDVTRSKLPDDRRRLIERACLEAKNDNADPARYIAITISQTVAHWKNQQYEVAENYLTEEIQKNGKIGEFYCLRGRTRLSISNRKHEQIESDFEQAEKYGCNPFDLLKYWFLLKFRDRDWRGLYRLHKRKKDMAEAFPVFNCIRVMASVRIGDKILSKTPKDAKKYYEEAIELSYDYINSGKALGYFHHFRSLMGEAAFKCLEAIGEDGSRKQPELERFRFVVLCLNYGLAPTHLVRAGLRSLEKWLVNVAPKAEISRQRSSILDDLDKLIGYLERQESVRVSLSSECSRLRTLL
ncbi:NB-ARC domain-containing protein [uncultured Roseibium sp.]|uniref:NB-ARC domain-containing protein n=1 Tax=uncultured Roseibium sp. TaxID=1936171 RepID=UPI002621BBAC|nr:NB-ARC domain-containing protein [uncultured Roseibium sp.]